MEKEICNLKDKKCLLTSFNLLLVFLVIWLGVGIVNKIKEGQYIGQDVVSKNTLVVSETGRVYAKPDLALTTISVVTEADTVAKAMAENSSKMNDVIDFVKSQGIEDKDIKTIGFNIYPQYEWQEPNTCFIPCPSGRRILVGYEVRQSLEVKIRDMEKVGAVLEGAATAGANEVSGLQFTIDKQDELKKQARNEAINKAKAKAQELAGSLGVKLVRIVSFNENSTLPYYYSESFSAYGKGGGEDVPQIESGENKIEVAVTISYEIN